MLLFTVGELLLDVGGFGGEKLLRQREVHGGEEGVHHLRAELFVFDLFLAAFHVLLEVVFDLLRGVHLVLFRELVIEFGNDGAVDFVYLNMVFKGLSGQFRVVEILREGDVRVFFIAGHCADEDGGGSGQEFRLAEDEPRILAVQEVIAFVRIGFAFRNGGLVVNFEHILLGGGLAGLLIVNVVFKERVDGVVHFVFRDGRVRLGEGELLVFREVEHGGDFDVGDEFERFAELQLKLAVLVQLRLADGIELVVFQSLAESRVDEFVNRLGFKFLGVS